ncbi:TPA: ead/Ea22-like family protein [Enterobacter hormaechei subsp. xiangfangensis]|nr:ead/Ea22-like family protein [Enterobacter hormaechei subsp. xiangfangensis]HAV1889367.1 ead/Ea22-like family protein [Enterobacter hormaechei subsp. xiangfangensis]
MSNIDKQALRVAAEKAKDNFIPNFMVPTREVLALLDELEAAEKRIAELSQKADIYDMLRQDYELHGSLVDFVDWQAKRIAELEAREVVLPQRYSMLHRVDFDEPYHTEMVYKQHQVLEALHDAGVNVAAAAKGE